MHRRLAARRGSILIVSYTFLAMFIGLQASSIVASLNEQRTAERYIRLALAFNLAEAGMDQAIAQLRANPTWAGVGYTAVSAGGGYQVALTNVTGTLFRLTSTGYYPSNNAAASGYQSRQVEAYVTVPNPQTYDYAMFAADSITLDSNAKVDSYDSNAGAYGDSNLGSDGDIGSNGTAAATVDLKSNANVQGDAVIGVGGNTATAITKDNNATLSGTKSALTTAKNLTPKSYGTHSPSTALTLNSNGSQTLSGGTYEYTYISLDSNSAVVVTGDATFYVDQYFHLDSNSSFVTACDGCTITIYIKGQTGANPASAIDLDSNSTLSSSLVSSTAKPAQLKVYITGAENATSAAPVNLDSNAKFFGSIDSPLSAVNLDSNVQVYGAIVAKTLTMNSNAQVHYDIALRSGNGGGAGSVTLNSWRDL